ncbi:MAG: alpha/beta fold hydrolase [Anaerolineales bacterium]|nr:alpha/beta fold hydrolase [Anaerolineales bacterium]
MKDGRLIFCYTRRMKLWGKRPFLILLVSCFWLAACTSPPISPDDLQPPTYVPQPQSEPVPTGSSQLSVAGNQLAELPATATVPQSPISSPQSPTPTSVPPTATLSLPTPTPDPYAALTIEALTARSYGGGQLDIIDTLEENETFTRYLITYPSDGLTIYGFMNVPNEGSEFPVALVLHGYIDPAEYDTLTYTRRYADALAEAGYFVIHPNFRNYPPSDEGSNPYRIGYAVDVLNLIAIIREQSQDPFGYLRRADEDRIHLWGHSMGGGVALRVLTVNNEAYLRAAVLYGSMSGDERQNFEQIQIWSDGENGPFELAASNEKLAAISPINFLERINTPISIHHSEADQTVPIAWSIELCERLRVMGKVVECYTYYATPHTFRGQADELFMERVIRFFDEN